MLRPDPRALALGAAGLVALATGLLLNVFEADPNAQQSHGTEAAFATGLLEREIGPLGPQRWTRERAVFRFEGLPEGPASLEVRVRGHRTPISVRANSRELGVLPQTRFVGRYELPAGPEHGVVVVELVTPGFRGGDGVQRGAFVDRVRVRPRPAPWPRARTVAVFAAPALALTAAALAAGLTPPAAALLAAGVTLAQALALWPDGLLYSPYAARLAFLLMLAGLAAWLAARGLGVLAPGSSPGAFVALLVALLVQGLAASSPVMVSSDVVFHANRLGDAAEGELFPTSVTQHATPFRIPYGVSFYALLSPLARLGFDRVGLVTAGAGLSGVIASAALFALLARRHARLATLAVVALQLLPGTFTIHSYGNLSNAFGQAVTALFFCWWSGGAPGGLLVGALLFAVAGISHLSSLIVLGVLTLGLVLARRSGLRRDTARLGALALGIASVVTYYAHFAGLVLEQLPRLLEGGGQGRGGPGGLWGVLAGQLHIAVAQFGWPALLLAGVGLLAFRTAGSWLEAGVARDLAAYMAAVAVLALPALVSPLEVRYLYALGLPLAVAAACGFLHLGTRGRSGQGLATLLALAQFALAASVIADCVLYRYRQ